MSNLIESYKKEEMRMHFAPTVKGPLLMSLMIFLGQIKVDTHSHKPQQSFNELIYSYTVKSQYH